MSEMRVGATARALWAVLQPGARRRDLGEAEVTKTGEGKLKMRKCVSLAVAVLALSAAAACSDEGDSPTREASNGSSHGPEKSAPARAGCETHGVLTVTDQGFSKLSGSSDENLKAVSFAAVVKNSGAGPVTANGAVTVTFVDSSGHELSENGEKTNGTGTPFSLGVLAPDSKRAVSGLTLLEKRPAAMKVRTSAPCVKGDATGDVAVADADLSVDGGDLTAELDLDSPLHKERRGFPVFVFRDSRHRIVGGGPYHESSGRSQLLSIPKGKSRKHVTVEVEHFLPDEADLDATTVYVQSLPG